MSHSSKRLGTLVWAFLECMFFSSIVVGWTWLAMVFRSDGYFLESSCNTTEVNVTSSGYNDLSAGVQVMGKFGELQENTGEHKGRKTNDCRSRRQIRAKGYEPPDPVNKQGIFEAGVNTLFGTSITRLPDQTNATVSSFHNTPSSRSSPILVHATRNIVSKITPSTSTDTSKYGPHRIKLISDRTSSSNIKDLQNHRRKHLGGLQPNSHIRPDTITFRTITQPAFPNGGHGNNNKSPRRDSRRRQKNNEHPRYSSSAYSSDHAMRVSPSGYHTVLKVVGYCHDQNEKIRTMFAVVLLVRDLLAFPVCFVYDKYGTTRTRLFTVLLFALGTLMMTFTSSSFPWLVIPALTLTGLAGSAVFLTNLQTANLFGRKRHVIISLYVGAAYSNGVITLLMKLTHFNGVDLQTSFMILTIAIVPVLVSTVAFLPKTRIPWPLPADYGKRRNQSLDEAMLRRQRAWQRSMSDNEFDSDSPLYGSTEAGLVRSRKPAPQFSPIAIQSLFVWSVLWFSCQRLQEAVFETHLVDIAPEPLDEGLDVDMETYYSSIQLVALVLSPLAGLLIDRDPRPALGLTQATQQMQRIVPAIVTTSMFGFLEVATDMMYGPGARGITIIFNILHKVFTYTTMCAFVMHLHFNHQNLGKLYGLTLSLSAVFSAFQFPIRTYLIKKYDSMFPAHILLLILNLVALAHAINAWDHCRKRLIKDQSDNSSERFSRLKQSGHTPTTIHIETDDRNLPGNHGDGLGVMDQTENSTTEVSGFVSSHNAPSEEKDTTAELVDLPSKGTDANGGTRIVFAAPFRDDDDDDDDDEVYGDEDDDVMEDVKRGYNGLQTIDFV